MKRGEQDLFLGLEGVFSLLSSETVQYDDQQDIRHHTLCMEGCLGQQQNV